MAAQGKVQVKVYLPERARDVLKENAEVNGVSMSKAVEDLVLEVLEPELKAEAAQ